MRSEGVTGFRSHICSYLTPIIRRWDDSMMIQWWFDLIWYGDEEYQHPVQSLWSYWQEPDGSHSDLGTDVHRNSPQIAHLERNRSAASLCSNDFQTQSKLGVWQLQINKECEEYKISLSLSLSWSIITRKSKGFLSPPGNISPILCLVQISFGFWTLLCRSVRSSWVLFRFWSRFVVIARDCSKKIWPFCRANSRSTGNPKSFSTFKANSAIF